jgi:cell division septum initiation protein DivIVA
MSEKVKVHTTHDINERKKRKYKQGEFQAIWDYLDELKANHEKNKKEITKLTNENKKLKEKLNGKSNTK